MLTIYENKWDVKYIQISTTTTQQKVLRKILGKVFITYESTQLKTSRTLKLDEFKIPFVHKLAQVLDIPNHMQRQDSQIY